MRLYPWIRPALFRIPPETAHTLAIRTLALAAQFMPAPRREHKALQLDVFGKQFPNPLGVAAGLDKNGYGFDGLLRLGFGFTEIGTVTPRPQTGNPRPRLFRLPDDDALINHMGFNNDGYDAVYRRVASRRRIGLIGINLGANKTSETESERLDDYETGAVRFRSIADYLTLNVSSPNTPRLRDLQKGDALAELLKRVKSAAGKTPVLVKLAPDIDMAQLDEIIDAVRATKTDGIIVSNTTIKLPEGRTETGGLSGRPLFAPATALLAETYKRTRGEIPLIGVGGIDSAETAYAKIRNGATLLQLYTALIYQGPGLVADIKNGLAHLLQRDGFATITEAIGADVTLPKPKKPAKETAMLTLYHNPRCSKSREALRLIEEAGASVKVINYLDAHPSKTALTRITRQLGLKPADIIRTSEPIYKELDLKDATAPELIAAMVAHPILLQRPILIHKDGRAVLGRPPENILPLLA